LGISANITLKDVEVNLSGNALGSGGLQILEACLPTISNISVLDLSDNGMFIQSNGNNSKLSLLSAVLINGCIY
jgi:Ran GTPase-activating protein (RanGAP) involved in mRNA processing and transport